MKLTTRTIQLLGLIAFGLLSLQANALKPNSQRTYFEHMLEVNAQWKHHKEACPENTVSFESDIDRINTHLNLVISHLRKTEPKGLSSTQTKHRRTLLDQLQTYANQKVFPINLYHTERQPYFVDHLGTHCAVGEMVRQSGHAEVVTFIRNNFNYDYIEDMPKDRLLVWATEHGFSLDELMWIQPGYSPSTQVDPILGGANGRVNNLVYDVSQDRIIVAGDFSELDQISCAQIGYYKNNQLSCLDGGLNGVLNEVLVAAGNVYAFGNFTYNGGTYPVAIHDGSNWQFLSIPNRTDATITAAMQGYGVGGTIFRVATSHASMPNIQEIYEFTASSLDWLKKAEVNGQINAIGQTNDGPAYAGYFDEVTIFDNGGIVQSTVSVNNMVISQPSSNNWYGINGPVSDTIHTIFYAYGGTYFGGSCTEFNGDNHVCVSRFLNGTLQPVMINYEVAPASVSIIEHDGHSELYFGGNFYTNQSMTFGANLARYDVIYNQITALANFNLDVNSLLFRNGDLFIGGDFTANGTQGLNRLAKISFQTNISEKENDVNLLVYPNPTSDILRFEGTEDAQITVTLFNQIGKAVLQRRINSGATLNVEELPSATYTYQVVDSKQVYSGSFVKM